MTWNEIIVTAERHPDAILEVRATDIIKVSELLTAAELVVKTEGAYDLDLLAEAVKALS